MKAVAGAVVVVGMGAAEPCLAGEAGRQGPRTVAVVLYNGVELLDFAGPSEVFAAAGRQAAEASGGPPAFRVITVARTKEPVLSQQFLRVTPEYSIDDAPAADVLVIPGGNSGAVQRDPKMMAWLAGAARRSEVTLTVCTGIFTLLPAGLLDGKEVTTWYGALDDLRREATRSTVQSGRRFVDNGQIVTTAGVSAGIDGALHTVARLLGRDIAGRTAQYMEYHWTPEAYLASGYPLLNPSTDAHGRDLQRAGIAEGEGDLEAAAAQYRAALAKAGDDGEAWMRLGRLSMRTRDHGAAVSSFVRASESAALRPVALYNAACAAAQGGRREEAVALLQKSMAAGFEQPSYILDDPDLAALHADPRVQALAAAAPVKTANASAR